MTEDIKNKLFTAVEKGFYKLSKEYSYKTRTFKIIIKRVKVAVIKLNYKDHTKVVLSTTFKSRGGYEEFDPEDYGITWALTKEELKYRLSQLEHQLEPGNRVAVFLGAGESQFVYGYISRVEDENIYLDFGMMECYIEKEYINTVPGFVRNHDGLPECDVTKLKK